MTDLQQEKIIIEKSGENRKKGVFIEENNGLQVKYSDNYFDLRPGEKKMIRIDYSEVTKKPTFSVRAY